MALEKAIVGKAAALLSGPGGLASFLRRRLLGARLGGPSLPLDIGYSDAIPASIRNAVKLRACTASGPADTSSKHTNQPERLWSSPEAAGLLDAQVTINGFLRWERRKEQPDFRVMRRVRDGKPFAGALVAPGEREGQMFAFVISDGPTAGIHMVQLQEKHLNMIRQLSLEFPADCESRES